MYTCGLAMLCEAIKRTSGGDYLAEFKWHDGPGFGPFVRVRHGRRGCKMFHEVFWIGDMDTRHDASLYLKTIFQVVRQMFLPERKAGSNDSKP